MVQLGVDLGPVFEPGVGWEYSNTNFIIAGLIAEAVTGQTFGQAVRATLLEPAGLDATYFAGEETIEGELAHGFTPDEDLTFSHHPSAAWAAGAMVMTVGDLAAWADALYRGPLLSDASRAEMLAGVATGDPELPYYGLGLEMPALDAGAVVGHGGLFPGYTTAMGLRTDSDDVVVAISNTYGYYPQWEAVGYGLLALDDARADCAGVSTLTRRRRGGGRARRGGRRRRGRARRARRRRRRRAAGPCGRRRGGSGSGSPVGARPWWPTSP